MTQENKKLLLQDLCARAPYGVMCHYDCVADYGTTVVQKANCVNKLEGIIPFNGQIGYMVGVDKVNALSGNIKPYLRSLSSMTKEEDEELRLLKDALVSCDESNDEKFNGIIAEIDEFYYSHYLDLHNLIPKDLALEAPKDMYNKEK